MAKVNFKIRSLLYRWGNLIEKYDIPAKLDFFDEDSNEYHYSIDIESVNDLLELVRKVGHQIIIEESFWCDEVSKQINGASLVIYDDFNE